MDNKKQKYWPSGVKLMQMRIDIRGQASVDEWKELFKSVRMNWIKKEDMSWQSTFAAVNKDSQFFYHGEFESTSPDGTNANFRLVQFRKPDEEPPKGLLEASGRVGGFPTILKRLAKGWPGENDGIEAHVYVAVDDTEFQPRFGQCDKTMQLDGKTVKIAPVSSFWDIDMDSVSQLSLLRGDDDELIFGAGFFDPGFELSETLCDQVEENACREMMKLLKKVS